MFLTMDTVNSRGHVIESLDSSDPYYRMSRRLKKLKYPQDLDKIKHLPYTQFKCWVYGLDPKIALFLTNERKFRMIQERQVQKNWWLEFYDSVWRVLHGIDF